VDYELSDSFINERNYVVINSLLSPLNAIKIDFYQTEKVDSGYKWSPLSGVHIVLKENDTVLCDSVCEKSELKLPQYPKAGKNYYLEASVNGQIIKATTYIPVQAKCDKVSIYYGKVWQDQYLHFSSFQIDAQQQAGLWIATYDIFPTGDKEQCYVIHTSHPLIDKFNQESSGSGLMNPQVGSYQNCPVLRIKNTNLPLFDNLFFLPGWNGITVGEQIIPIDPPSQYQVKLIMASNEYDRYCKTLIEQKYLLSYDDDPFAPILYQPKQVYSNIIGGLGIFAGMNETDYYFKANNYE
jgi:hypothetical protein